MTGLKLIEIIAWNFGLRVGSYQKHVEKACCSSIGTLVAKPFSNNNKFSIWETIIVAECLESGRYM